MDTTNATGRRRSNLCVNAEDNALDQITKEAEARLAARRQARAEAREIRMRELERLQKEQEQNADRAFDIHTSGSIIIDTFSSHPARTTYGGLLNLTRSTASRRSSEDSLEDDGQSLRDVKRDLKEVEERFRKAMITNAQLDNDRSSQTYEVKLLKDKDETMQEAIAQLQRELKNKLRDCNALKRNLDRTTLELNLVQGQLTERDSLIAEHGLVIVAIENTDGSDAKRALVSIENANTLATMHGSLDVRLKKLTGEKERLLIEMQNMREQLDAYKCEGRGGRCCSFNGPVGYEDDYELQTPRDSGTVGRIRNCE